MIEICGMLGIRIFRSVKIFRVVRRGMNVCINYLFKK
jgi:hypothetical protein